MGSPMSDLAGPALAMTEAILIAAIAGRWRLRLAADARIEPTGFITLRPRSGVPMR